jgi:aminomuconate-semialdehyde/2-hydroxymuconate-6-semialdehyde dehydrogenase
MIRIAHFIDGAFQEPASGDWIPDHEPAVGEPFAEVADGDERDVLRAVEAASRAFPGWARTSAEERSAVLLRIADGIEARRESLARDESTDTGKPVSLAANVDIPRAVANLRFFATAILHTSTEAHITERSAWNLTLRKPRGVAACISPWNLPLYLFTWKIAPALASGNTVVGKPSELTPLTAFRLAEICMETGLPRGVLNIVHGIGSKVGPTLTTDPRIQAISFTGGTATGAAIAEAAAPRFKKLSLELGGKNPNVIFADADMDRAVANAVRAAFSNQGQICLCGSRILVEHGAFDEFLERFAAAAASLRVGDPVAPETEFGAVVSRAHYEKILSYIDLAKREGGSVVAGGGPAPPPNARCRNGWFVQPTVVTGLPMTCRTNQEEIFGPVVTVQPFREEAEAVRLANETRYGLAATIWTRDLARAHRVAEKIEAGIVWVNCWMLRDLRTPFGGMKDSGVGREGGNEALRFFTEPKNVCIANEDEAHE